LFFFTVFVVGRLIEGVGVNFESTVEGAPADAVGLSGIIYEIDGVSIKSQMDLEAVLSQIEPGKTVKILTTEGEFELATIESPYVANMSYLGIENPEEVYKYSSGPFAGNYVSGFLINSLVVWYNLLSWVFVLSIGVAIVNLLPMKPLDGGYIFEELAKNYFGQAGKRLAKIATISTAILLIFNLIFFDLLKFLLSLVP